MNSASAESDWKDCLSTENTALLAVRTMNLAIDSTNAYVPRRLKVASGALLLCEGGRGSACGEAVGCGLHALDWFSLLFDGFAH